MVSWAEKSLAYVRARSGPNGWEILKMGVESQGGDTPEDFVKRLEALGLKGCDTSAMLRPEQYYLLQVPAPTVPPEELKSAVRYQIRDMVDIHIDDLTLDVFNVGDGQQKANPQLFVAAANNAHVRSVMTLASAMDWPVTVIDIQEACQRNLQSAAAKRNGTLERADAALVLTDGQHALFTISVNGELYYTRRLDVPAGFLDMAWSQAAVTEAGAPDGFTPVDEYVPDYAGGSSAFTTARTEHAETDMERAQRLAVEVQRSLDLWDRSWSGIPLAALRVSAGERSVELAEWLGRETGQTVMAIDLEAMFTGLENMPLLHRMFCAPLLGLLLRTENRVA